MAQPSVTDAELIARVVVQDDRHAFSELVRRHQSAVRATLRRLTGGNDALADDLAQETFLLAYRNLKSFRQEARFSTWLYRIATNAFFADARKRKEELLGDADAELADDDEPEDSPGEGSTDMTRAANLRVDMTRALALLSEAERAVGGKKDVALHSRCGALDGSAAGDADGRGGLFSQAVEDFGMRKVLRVEVVSG